jgi:hypothetical protein
MSFHSALQNALNAGPQIPNNNVQYAFYNMWVVYMHIRLALCYSSFNYNICWLNQDQRHLNRTMHCLPSLQATSIPYAAIIVYPGSPPTALMMSNLLIINFILKLLLISAGSCDVHACWPLPVEEQPSRIDFL